MCRVALLLLDLTRVELTPSLFLLVGCERQRQGIVVVYSACPAPSSELV